MIYTEAQTVGKAEEYALLALRLSNALCNVDVTWETREQHPDLACHGRMCVGGFNIIKGVQSELVNFWNI